MHAYTDVQQESHRIEDDDSPVNISPHWNRLVTALILSLAVHASLLVPKFPQLSVQQSQPQSVAQSLTIHLTNAKPKKAKAQTVIRPAVKKKIRTAIKPTPPHQVVSTITEQPSPSPQLTTNSIPVTTPMLTPLSTTASTIMSLPLLQTPRIRPIYSPQPVYPKIARRLGLEGKVILRIWISADGVPSDIVVKKSSGYETLDLAAKEGVRKWRFELHGGIVKSGNGWINLPVTFRLQ